MIESYQIIGAVIVGLGSIGGVFVTFNTLKSSFKKELQSELSQSMALAKLQNESDFEAVTAKLMAIESRIDSVEVGASKDLEHLRLTYSSEIKNLGSKIETLREEIRQSHSSLISLLTKLIDR